MAWNFKNEEEVKQFSDKLGNDYRFGCFNEKKPEGEIGICDQCYHVHTLNGLFVCLMQYAIF
jgi:hypothetical protein